MDTGKYMKKEMSARHDLLIRGADGGEGDIKPRR